MADAVSKSLVWYKNKYWCVLVMNEAADGHERSGNCKLGLAASGSASSLAACLYCFMHAWEMGGYPVAPQSQRWALFSALDHPAPATDHEQQQQQQQQKVLKVASKLLGDGDFTV